MSYLSSEETHNNAIQIGRAEKRRALIATLCANHMSDKFEIWNRFHDGSITKITGELPAIEVRIEIEYLRHIFSNDGNSIIVFLDGCSLFQYLDWDEEDTYSDLSKIEKLEPEILSVNDSNEEMASIFCACGELKLAYESMSLTLDNGKVISVNELNEACSTYWTNWKNAHNKSN